MSKEKIILQVIASHQISQVIACALPLDEDQSRALQEKYLLGEIWCTSKPSLESQRCFKECMTAKIFFWMRVGKIKTLGSMQSIQKDRNSESYQIQMNNYVEYPIFLSLRKEFEQTFALKFSVICRINNTSFEYVVIHVLYTHEQLWKLA